MAIVEYSKEMAFMIYPSKCTGCRSCQIACKNWNQNVAQKTINSGTYENPPSLDYFNFTKIKFSEYGNGTDYGINWLFLKEQCLHCTDATCMIVCPSDGQLLKGEDLVAAGPDQVHMQHERVHESRCKHEALQLQLRAVPAQGPVL